MKFLTLALVALLAAAPAMSQTTGNTLLLAPSAQPSAASVPDPYISVKQASYGPFWGKYRSLTDGMRAYCGDQSTLCEVYCPKSHKACWVVYGCGDHITKSLQVYSGELIVMDCRQSIPGLARN